MKKITAILACMLVCFLLFTGCTDQKDGSDQDTNLGNSVEIDDTDIAIDTEPGLDTICTNLLVKKKKLCHNKSQGVIYYEYKYRRINKTFTRRIPAGML